MNSDFLDELVNSQLLASVEVKVDFLNWFYEQEVFT